MLGTDHFTFETPNVIDPGDLPPSQPPRQDQFPSPGNGSDGGGESKIEQNGACNVLLPQISQKQYYDERSARLLRDISDLELSSPEHEETPSYDPYRDDDDDGTDEEEPAQHNHSLPTVDEARMHAAALLQNSKRRGIDFQRTVKLKLPRMGQSGRRNDERHHLVRKLVMRHAWKICAIIVAIILAIVITVVVVGKKGAVANPMATSPRPIKGVDIKQRKQDIINFLALHDITSRSDLNDSSSAQAQAVDWLAQYDALIRPVPSSLRGNQRFVQRYVLVTLFFALSGKDWTNDYKFLSSEDECAWFQDVIVSDFVAQDTAAGVSCDPGLRVQSLFMPDNNLQGTLPSELQFLSSLDMIAMPFNTIIGTIPFELQVLTSLIYIDFKYNQLSGMLPSWIGDLAALEVLGLSNNQLVGSVPANFGSLGRLKTIALDDNAFTGDLDWANHLTNLQYFYGERNMFTGHIGDTFLSNLQLLTELDVSSTALTAEVIPLHLLEHPSLEVLDLSDNNISGSLPETQEVNRALRFLSIRHCNISGSLPGSLSRFKSLEHLDLTGNAITGSIPNVLGQMTDLRFLFLGDNEFDTMTELPPLFSQLIQLRELSLESTNLSGTIPSWLAYLESLKLLNLSANKLQGTVPQVVWDLPVLGFLLLHDNLLAGDIPIQVKGVEKFEMLTLFKNSFTGDVNSFCGEKPDLPFLAVDCGVTCDPSCCEACCRHDDEECFKADVPKYLTGFEGMWEFGFDRASYGFDPSLLDESGFITVVSPGVDGNGPSTLVYDMPSETLGNENFQFPFEQGPSNYFSEPVEPSTSTEYQTPASMPLDDYPSNFEDLPVTDDNVGSDGLP
jgi:Leucine-rich repeat (LRR) protein